ncbi:hypothetical protein [Pontiella sulfatireligans]|uniref:Uncharacterized protein n=1 Tax=Pontiella sulfatireligans TaxID=2750658 RepID=A0A6C2UQF8_9BACT|nr:hypothetical protein [Pontiella sulfatireligans]VGO22309.1 hypothetical protein SCARR_04392 [Pontiella sulfatireligans]
MKFVIDKKHLVRMLKIVNHRDMASISHRKKNQYLRIKAYNMEVELEANGVAISTSAMITEKGVCFIRYRGLLELVQSYKKKKIYIVVTPDGLQIETYHASDELWYAIFDDPKMAPASIEEVQKDKTPEPSFVSSTAIQDWRDMYRQS